MRTVLIAGNFKMHKTVGDTVKYIKQFRSLVKDVIGVEVVLAVPFTAVHAAAEAARNSNVEIGAQDLYWEREGAFTGEISGDMIRERSSMSRSPVRLSATLGSGNSPSPPSFASARARSCS